MLYALYWFRPYVPRMAYEINKEYIANNLCENRNKPEMHCNGKCHLRKQIDLLDVSPLEDIAPPKKEAQNKDNKTKKKTLEIEYWLLFRMWMFGSYASQAVPLSHECYRFLYVPFIFEPPRRQT